MRSSAPVITAIVVGLVIATSLAVFWYVFNASFGACARGTLGENYQNTIKALDGTIDVGLKLSTTLVGFGAALLIGIKDIVRMTAAVRLTVLVSTLLFAESALYGVWWRLGVANSWLNECLNLIMEPSLQRRYLVHFDFFLLGLLSLGLVVITATFARPETGRNGS
jgi:hypothetical protein